MRRRDFIAGIAGSAVAWPTAAGAQQPAIPAIGLLQGSSPEVRATWLAAFLSGLDEQGFIEGRTVTIEYRYAAGRYDRLVGIAAELVHHPVAVILAASLPAALAAKQATRAVPVVFVSGADPVLHGLVDSLARPGGNLTGISNHFGAVGGKRLELLHELVPQAGLIGYLLNPSNQNADVHSQEVNAAARAMGQRIEVLLARDRREVEGAFATLVQSGAGALLVGDDPFLAVERDLLVALAARHRVPAIYWARDIVMAGGLLSYGSSPWETYRLAGLYTGRVLKGEKPSDLPVVLPTKFELVINLKTAKALGLTVPPSLLARADEVIE
jgi:putative ABC transport system substrate-binding protein